MLLAPTLTLSAGSGAAIVRPTFSRDFAGEKSLNNGTGPAITFTRASNATFFNASGVLQTASNDAPRFDHDPASGNASRGLLIEESRTNSIRNSQAGGAVSGSPGTAPTNWPLSGTAGGLTRTITAGTAAGLNYLDLRFNGTPTSLFQIALDPEAGTQVVASSGQSWTASLYIALIAGTAPDCVVGMSERTADGTFITSGATNVVSSLSSSLQRFSHTRTLTDATTARVSATFRVTATNGVPLDFTLRIAAPQLEQGAFPTSYIPTTTAAATRSADSAVVTPISSFYNQAEGTLFAEAVVLARNANIANISEDNSENNRLTLYTATARTMRWFINSNNVIEYNSESAAITSGANGRIAGAYKTNDVIAATNGVLSAADTSVVLPPVALTHFFIGRTATSFGPAYNGHIRKIAYYPRRLSNTLIQQLTT